MRLARLLLWVCIEANQAGKLLHKLQSVSKFFDPTSPVEHVTDVGVGIYFDHLYSIDDRARLFTTDFYLTYQWKDVRWANMSWKDEFIKYDLTESEVRSCHGSGPKGHRRLGGAAASHSNVSVAAPKCGEKYYFLELGHDEFDMIWRPDLHIRNLYLGHEKLHSEMLRIYQDGTIEQIFFIWAVLDMLDTDFSMYPFDKQDLTIIVESLSHTTKRIILHPLHEFTGLEESLTHHWPGWSHEGHEEYEYTTAPEYVHANADRQERRSRIKFEVHVQRNFSLMTLLPLWLLVATSWAGFFIQVAPDVRLATGFISYLTINQIAQSQLAGIPQVSYAVWYAILLNFCQYSVFLSIFQSVIAVCLNDRVSGRVSKSLDRFARVVYCGDFFIVMIVMLLLNNDPKNAPALQNLSKVNVLLVIVLTATFAGAMSVWVRRRLVTNPLGLYMQGLTPLDNNECKVIFQSIILHKDKHVEKDNSIVPSHIVDWLLDRPPISKHDDLRSKSHIFQDTLEEKFGTNHMTLEEFRGHQATMFIELRRFVHQSKDFERKKSFRAQQSGDSFGDAVESINVEVKQDFDGEPKQPTCASDGASSMDGCFSFFAGQVSELIELLKQNNDGQRKLTAALVSRPRPESEASFTSIGKEGSVGKTKWKC